jgi:hypothetical protein
MYRIRTPMRVSAVILALSMSASVLSGTIDPDDRALVIERPDHAQAASLVLLRSDGFHTQVEFAADAAIRLDEQRITELGLADGRYTFEVRFARSLPSEIAADLAELRQAGEPVEAGAPALQPVSGTVTIQDGQLMGGDTIEEEDDRSGSGLMAEVINDDLVVVGSTCIGFDCVSGESFGFDTLRLKENNTRMTFIDTSTIGGFPAGDWQLRANDSASGGADHFSVDWLGTSASSGNAPVSTPLRVDGEAPTNALRISSAGRIGLRTATPVLDLHLTTGNTPGHRLEQTDASGWAPQTWDIAGNETNFFIRDVTSGNTLPFRIRPGAPSSSIDISATGNVGIGTGSPSARLHVSDGDLRVDGAVYQLSSRALKSEFVRLDPGALLERLAQLDLGFWHYLDRRSAAPHYGPAAEDFSELFGLGETSDSISISDMAGVALGAAQALKTQLDERNARIESLEGEIDQLQHRLQRLEQLIESQAAGPGQ